MDFISLPVEITIEIISKLPFDNIIILGDIQTYLQPIIYDNLDIIIKKFMNNIKHSGDFYILYNCLNSLYKQYSGNLYIEKINYLKHIQLYVNHLQTFYPNANFNFKKVLDEMELSQEILDLYFDLSVNENVPFNILFSSVSHKDILLLQMMKKLLSLFRHQDNYIKKFEEAYNAVFHPTLSIFENVTTDEELNNRLTIFKTLALLKNDTIENIVDVAKTLDIEYLPGVIELVNRNFSIPDAQYLFYYNMEDPSNFEKAMSLVQAGCEVVDAGYYARIFNDSRFELFKKLVIFDKNNCDLYFSHINSKPQEYIECYEFLINSNQLSLKNMTHVSLFTYDQCKQMLQLINDGITSFDDILAKILFSQQMQLI